MNRKLLMTTSKTMPTNQFFASIFKLLLLRCYFYSYFFQSGVVRRQSVTDSIKYNSKDLEGCFVKI